MPIIQLIQPTKTADAGRAVLDNQRRPTVDSRGLQQAAGQLASAQRQPDAPMSLAANGLEYIGGAIAKAGGVLGALAIEKQDAITRKQIGEADTAIAVERDKHESWKVSTQADPLTWEERRAQSFLELKERTMANESLTREAKEQISLRMDRENGLWQASDGLLATKKQFGDVRDMTVANMRRHIDSQDRDGYEAEKKAGGKYLSEIEKESLDSDFTKTGERIALKLKADELDAAESATITYAQGTGEASAIDYVDSLPLDASKKETLKNIARRTARTYDGEAQDFVLDGISNGDIKTPERIDEIAKDSPHLSPRVVESMKAHLAKKQTFEMQNDPASVAQSQAEISAMIRGYDRKDDADGMKALQIKTEIGLRLKGDNAGYMRTILKGKFDDKPAKFTVPQESKAVLDDALNSLFDPVKGSMPWKKSEPLSVLHKTADDPWFGKPAYKVGDPVLGEDGKPKVAMGEDGRAKTKTVIDDTAKSRAVDMEQKIRFKFSEWARLNPDDLRDPAKIRARVLQEAAGVLDAGVLRDVMKKLPPPAATGAVLPKDTISVVKQFEGFNSNAYGDYKQSSIGYGTRAKHSGEVLTESEAEDRLRSELSMHAKRVDESAKQAGVNLTDSQRTALVSFDFNTGQGSYLIESSGGKMDEIKRRLLLYTKAGGQDLPGLIDRRKREAAML